MKFPLITAFLFPKSFDMLYHHYYLFLCISWSLFLFLLWPSYSSIVCHLISTYLWFFLLSFYSWSLVSTHYDQRIWLVWFQLSYICCSYFCVPVCWLILENVPCVLGIIHQADITLNICALSQGARKYVKQLLTELKGDTNQNTILVGDLNTPQSDMDRSSKQKINMGITSLNDTLDQLDIIESYRAFYPKTAAYTFFSSVHGTFSRIYHILGHRDSLNKYKRVEIIPVIFSDHNALKLEINCKKKSGRTKNSWRLNKMLLKNLSIWVWEEIKKRD